MSEDRSGAKTDTWLLEAVNRKNVGVPDNFPDVTVRILEVPSVTTEACFTGRLDDFSSSPGSLSHHLVNFFARHNVVPDGEGGRTNWRFRFSRVVSDIVLGPNCEPQPIGEREKG